MIIAIVVLGLIGLISALVLYGASKRFQVNEDERLETIIDILPGANCGGCGFPGCSGFAKACIKGADEGSLKGLVCVAGGNVCMQKIADALGMKADMIEPKVAVVRCNGTCENRPTIAQYDGRQTCANINVCGAGESACGYGCLGCGDCTRACSLGAIIINPQTGLPEVDEEKCGACGACVNACPRHIIELRKKGIKGRRVWVDCVNKDKGPVAKKACSVACIGCGLCAKECAFDAITIANNCSYIDAEKCRLCKKCVEVCPTNAIHTANFPIKAIKDETQNI